MRASTAYILVAAGLSLLGAAVWGTRTSAGPAAGGGKSPPGGRSVPMLGGTPARNMVDLVDKDVADNFSVKKGAEKGVKFVIRPGNKAYGGPVIAGGRIFLGTNNERPRDPRVRGDRGVVMCFRESDGAFLWQAVHDKLPGGEVNDYPREGIASTPCVEGDRLYYVSNRCEVVCADVAGDEATGKAKLLWVYDMIKEQGVFPCQLCNCSPLVLGDLVYVVTGNGVDAGNGTLPAPKAPSFLALNRNTGKLAWKSSLPGDRILRGQWSNPAAAVVNGQTQVIFPGGDGWMYGLEAKTGELIWKFDCNPRGATPYKPGGGGQKSFMIATPVVHDNRCYIATGQEPDDGPGVGHLWCIDITRKPANKEKDLSPVGDNFDPKAEANKDSGLVWHYGGPAPKDAGGDREFVFGRTLSTVAVVDDVVYAAELNGYLHCIDAKTGKKHWEYDFQESTWCSPYYVDGKVYIGTDSGDLYIFRHGKKLTEPRKIPVGGQIKVPVVCCNGVLYINAGPNVYAIR